MSLNIRDLTTGYPNVFWDGNSFIDEKNFMERSYFKEVIAWLDEEMEDFSKYDFYFFINLDSESDIASSIENPQKSVLLWIGDENGKYPKQFVSRFHRIFKSHLRKEISDEGLFSLPLGFPSDFVRFDNKPVSTRKYDVFFSGNLNNNRVPFYFSFYKWPLSVLSKYKNLPKFLINRYTKKLWLRFKSNFNRPSWLISFTEDFAKGLTHLEYSKILRDSKIALSPKGFHSPECFRTYEALSAGCIVISEPLPSNTFYKGSPIIEVSHWCQAKKIINRLLSNPEKLEALSQRSREWYEQHLSPHATARYIAYNITKAND